MWSETAQPARPEVLISHYPDLAVTFLDITQYTDKHITITYLEDCACLHGPLCSGVH